MKEENANNHFYHVKKGVYMTDEIMHTVIPNNSGWGGTALGAGVGGLIGSVMASAVLVAVVFLPVLVMIPEY